MPELPEVETVKNVLKGKIVGRKILGVDVFYNLIKEPSKDEFVKLIKNQNILDIKRRGKFLMFELDDYYLLSHLRMEGKYYIDGKITKHDHIVFHLNGFDLKYNDTRKFGRMYLIKKNLVYQKEPLNKLGLEPFDLNLNIEYLKQKYKNKKSSIKTLLLDQSIITGIGNIYADEILFLSKINPLQKGSTLSDEQLNNIIINTKLILKQAIKKGGTTIRSYESEKGVHGTFQNDLKVHNHENEKCPICGGVILKIKVNGRGTYFCSNCQRRKDG